MKILNLYAGIGGNRELWGNRDSCDGHHITAVESDPAIAEVYAKQYPHDEVIVGDAHEYLLTHFGAFDFIWSSPPCQSHGQYRFNVGVLGKGYKPLYPDMKLYEEVILLKHHYTGAWAVENTKPYYTPLIAPSFTLQRHLFWSNFPIAEKDFSAKHIRSKNKIGDYANSELVKNSSIRNKRQVLRNCVDGEVGKHVFDAAIQFKYERS